MDTQTNTTWLDQSKREHDIREVSDDYLKNIVHFVAEGGGYDITDDKIRAIYSEVKRRRIKPAYTLKETLWYWEQIRKGNLEEAYEARH